MGDTVTGGMGLTVTVGMGHTVTWGMGDTVTGGMGHTVSVGTRHAVTVGIQHWRIIMGHARSRHTRTKIGTGPFQPLSFDAASQKCRFCKRKYSCS